MSEILIGLVAGIFLLGLIRGGPKRGNLTSEPGAAKPPPPLFPPAESVALRPRTPTERRSMGEGLTCYSPTIRRAKYAAPTITAMTPAVRTRAGMAAKARRVSRTTS